jgi:hypothetical protein
MCTIQINLDGGDIQFDVSNDEQLFSFRSGLAFIAIPQFFSTLTSFYQGNTNQVTIDCHGYFDYYIFSSDGEYILIEHKSHYPIERIVNYQFTLREYMEAIEQGFKKYLVQLENEGIFPFKDQAFAHPLGEDVLNAFYNFSSLLKA